ncbi:hypothetical protein IGI04_002962 [Brassica rapa subsp. trilocularis]|uniref:AIG1-type G domain-containing protein n=1 Tax=Brassica rapa subsp. trilocularis TaxID=1813537 RepID=A0ABQ7NX19_BRACM|nr:hypothetical protein IGI04_002962 [Brassica rapa subsp. trilocularis]
MYILEEGLNKQNIHSEEEGDLEAMASVGEGELKSLKNLCNEITEALSPQGMETNSIHLLFKNHAKTQQHHVDTELENGGIQEHHVFVHNNLNDVLIKMDLEGNNGRNLHLVRRLMKKQRMFIRLNQMIPSYKLIPEEERCSVKYEKLTEYEEAMTKSENEMIEADRLMERMISAVEKLEIRVIKGEMKGRRLG